MQVSIETTQGLERKMTISLPAAEVEKDIFKKLQHLARTQRMPGFRPGKIPLSVIRKKYGNAVKQDIYADFIERNFYDAISQQKIMPAGAPRIVPRDVQDGLFEFDAFFDVFPEVKVADLSALEVTQPVAEVTDNDVDKMLETLRKQRAEWVNVKRMAKKGDQVVCDFAGSVDGEAFEGGKGENVAVILGQGQMLADFEKGLLKIKTGEEREIKVTFPDDYQAEELAGKTAIFKVKANQVKGQKLPALDSEFVKQFGIESGNIEDLKAEVRKNMERELAQTLKNNIKTAVFDALLAANTVELPRSLLDEEIDRLRQKMSQQVQRQGQGELPELPGSIFEDEASKKLSLSFLVSEIIDQHKLTADKARIKSTLEEMSSAYDDPKEVIDWYYSDKSRLAEIESLVLEDTVVDLILGQAGVTKQTHSFDEIMNPKSV